MDMSVRDFFRERYGIKGEEALDGLEAITEVIQMKRGDILLHGHTHVPAKQEFDGKYYLNPGSVSIPKEESPHGYLMLEEGDFTWKTLEGKEYNYAGSKEFDI